MICRSDFQTNQNVFDFFFIDSLCVTNNDEVLGNSSRKGMDTQCDKNAAGVDEIARQDLKGENFM